MIYTIKSISKDKNLFFKWLKIPTKLIPTNLKWLIAMIGYNKLALVVKINKKEILRANSNKILKMHFSTRYKLSLGLKT